MKLLMLSHHFQYETLILKIWNLNYLFCMTFGHCDLKLAFLNPKFQVNLSNCYLVTEKNLSHLFAKPIFWHWDIYIYSSERKYSIFAESSKEHRCFILKISELPSGCQGMIFKGNIWGESVGLINFFWLVIFQQS